MIRQFVTTIRPPRGAAAVLLLLVGLLLTACGQKGPLYIPDMDPDEEIRLEDPL